MASWVWREARKRARAETLDLLRLNDPWRALLVIGVPVVALAVSWEATSQLALATLAALGGTLLFGLFIFAAKTVLASATIAVEERAAREAVVADYNERSVVLERRAVELENPPKATEYETAIYQYGKKVGELDSQPTGVGPVATFPQIWDTNRLRFDQPFIFKDEMYLVFNVGQSAGMLVRNDTRSFDLIKDRKSYEYELWAKGTKHYY